MPTKFITFNGKKYRLHKNGYYFADNWENAESLHRAIWAHHNGPIPEGHHVHHRDHDPSNNDIDNLELMTEFDHLSHHAKHGGWVGSAANLKQLREAAELSKEWHASEEGRAVHARIGKQSWENKEWVTVVCAEQDCRTPFETPFPDRAKYCRSACKERDRRRRAGLPLGKRRGTYKKEAA